MAEKLIDKMLLGGGQFFQRILYVGKAAIDL